MSERPGTVVVMFSHVSRESVREVTIREFARVGCPVAHVELQVKPPRQARNRRNAWCALRHAAREVAPFVGARGVLVIEDDVTPAETLPEWLAYLEAHEERPVSLYCPSIVAVERHPPGLRRWAKGHGAPPTSRVVDMQNQRVWWGSQAVWFPLEWARIISDDWRFGIHERGLGPWDYAIRAVFTERGATLGLAVPNVVQHRGERNVINPRKQTHKSASFLSAAPAPTREE